MVKGNGIKQKKKILRNNNKWSEKQVTEKAYYSQGRIYKTLFFQLHLQSNIGTMTLQSTY